MYSVDVEGEWLTSLGAEAKLKFLASLGYGLTVAGRNSYTVQESGLDKPEQLRQINEIQHRVLACLLQTLKHESSSRFERSIASWVLNHSDTEMKGFGTWAWGKAKEAIS